MPVMSRRAIPLTFMPLRCRMAVFCEKKFEETLKYLLTTEMPGDILLVRMRKRGKYGLTSYANTYKIGCFRLFCMVSTNLLMAAHAAAGV